MGGQPFCQDGRADGRSGGRAGRWSGGRAARWSGGRAVRRSDGTASGSAVTDGPPDRPAALLSTISAPPSSICCRRYRSHSPANGLLHSIEDRLGNFALRLKRQDLAGTVPAQQRDTIGVLLESRAGLERIIYYDQIESLSLQLGQALGQRVAGLQGKADHETARLP